MKLKYNLKEKEAQSLLYACCYFQKKRIKVCHEVQYLFQIFQMGRN